jgi:hypothetical protein
MSTNRFCYSELALWKSIDGYYWAVNLDIVTVSWKHDLVCWSTCSSTTIPLSLNVGDNFFSFFIFLFSFIHFFLIFGDIKCCIIHNSIFFHSFFLKLEGNIFFILFYPPFVLNFGGRRKYCIQIHVSISFIHSF